MRSAPHAITARTLFTGSAFETDRAVLIRDGRVDAIGAAGDVPPDMAVHRLDDDLILAPGFIDWQVNGGAGRMLNDHPTAETMAMMVAAYRPFGTTSLLPTLITDRPEVMARLAEAIAAPVPGVVGWHLEGPFLNVERKGIHCADFIRPMTPADVEMLARFAVGRSIVTLAPECAGAGMVRRLTDAGLIVSIGHSAATASETRRAADDGATLATHLFNAMSQIGPREPGIVGTVLDDARLAAGIIVDGHHVDPVNIRIAHRLMGPQRLTLVTDAMSTIGLPEGADATFDLMGRTIRRDGDRLVGPDGTLAGAHLTMIGAIGNCVERVGLPLADALAMATSSVARLLGLGDEIGAIRPGARADLVTFDPGSWQVRSTWMSGERADHG